MEKVINIDGHDIKFACTAGTPRRYRMMFRKDILTEMRKISEEAQKGSDLSAEGTETIENLAYVMAKQADPDIADNPLDWLDGFAPFSIYNNFPSLIELWTESTQTVERAKKKLKQ